MARPHRIQASDAVYHVTTRGVRRLEVYEDSVDYEKFEELLEAVVRKRSWAIYAYCQMPNHYHLLFRTPEADISDGMFWLNGVYARWFNSRHNYSGHLFEERFYSEVVRSNAHLLSLACYIPLNPVRAGLCPTAGDWPWSSYRATVGRRHVSWLSTDWLLEQFGNERALATIEYERFVGSRMAA
ncbi:MAG TPA: transposase [Gaiellaceae bacterium]|nr:transposase [Gaiellaceae bacterium]